MVDYTEESEEDASEGIAGVDDSVYAYGTPPTRQALKLVPRTRSTGSKLDGKRCGSGKPHRVASTKSVDPAAAVLRQARNMTAARRESKGRRQKARQQARFFKEIDTTLEALGIGTAPDAGVGRGPGGSTTGMPPSPASPALSVAMSSEQQLSILATPTALSSRAGTPPPGPGGLPAAGIAVGAIAAAAAAAGGLSRRITSDLSLKSSDMASGYSTPERHPSGAGMAPTAAITATAGAPGDATTTTPFATIARSERDISRGSKRGITTVSAAEASTASLPHFFSLPPPPPPATTLPPPLPPRSPPICIPSTPTHLPVPLPATTSTPWGHMTTSQGLMCLARGQVHIHPAPLGRRRAVPASRGISYSNLPLTVTRQQEAASTATVSAAVAAGVAAGVGAAAAVAAPIEVPLHRRTASFEGGFGPGANDTAVQATTFTAAGIIAGSTARAAAPAGPVPVHPSPVRGGWATMTVLPQTPAFGTVSAISVTGSSVGATAGGVGLMADGPPAPTLHASRSCQGLADRDTFRRQLGSVLVGHGLTCEEVQAQVEEAEERGEVLEARLGELIEKAENMEEEAGLSGRKGRRGRRRSLGDRESESWKEEEEEDDSDEEERQLVGKALRRTPFPWSDLSNYVTSLDEMYRKVKEVLRKGKPLRCHLHDTDELVSRLNELALRLLGRLSQSAEALGRAAACGLRCLSRDVLAGGGGGSGSGPLGSSRAGCEEEVRLGGRTVRRLLDALDHVTKKINDDAGDRGCEESSEMLSGCQAVILDLAYAGMEAAEAATPVLLQSGSLSPEGSAHEKSSQARRLVALWEEASRQTDRIAKRCSRQRVSLYGKLCDMYEKSGLLALDMTRGCAPGASGGEDAGGADEIPTDNAPSGDDISERLSCSSEFDHDNMAGLTAAWGGVSARAWGVPAQGPGRARRRGVSAEEVQAQAWVPGLLQVLLNRACEAHKNLREELAEADQVAVLASSQPSDEPQAGGGPGSELLSSGSLLATAASLCDLSDDQLEELWGLLDEMQQTFAELCLANLRRTVWLCTGGSGPLPLWALESVRDSAEAALRFIHTHEHSSVALGDMLEMEEDLGEESRFWLHSTWTAYTSLTRRVVDGLLSVRRQINVRRTVVASSTGLEPARLAVGGRGGAAVGPPWGRIPVPGLGRGRSVSGAPAAALVPPGRRQAGPPLGRGTSGFQIGPATATAGSAFGASLRSQLYPHPNPQLPSHQSYHQQQQLPQHQQAPQQQQQQPSQTSQRVGVSNSVPNGVSNGRALPSMLGLSARTPSQDPDTMAHWYDKAYDDGSATALPTLAGAPEAGVSNAFGGVQELAGVASVVPATTAAPSTAHATLSSGSKWKAALLSVPTGQLSGDVTLSTSPIGAIGAGGGGSTADRRLTSSGRTSTDAGGPGRPAVAPGAASTTTGPEGRTAALKSSSSASRLLPTPGPNSGTQRRVAAAKMQSRASGRGAGRHGAGRGQRRMYGKTRSRNRGVEAIDTIQPLLPPPPPPPPMDSLGGLPPSLDPWPRLRPHTPTDAGSTGASPDDGACDISCPAMTPPATLPVEDPVAVTATAAVVGTTMSVLPYPPSPTAAAGTALMSPQSPLRVQPPPSGVVSWASIAKGGAAASGPTPGRAGPLKSPFEVGASAHRVAVVAAAGVHPATACGGSGRYVASPFKALAQQPPLGSPSASMSPLGSPRPSAPPSPEMRPAGGGGGGAQTVRGTPAGQDFHMSADVCQHVQQKLQVWLATPSAPLPGPDTPMEETGTGGDGGGGDDRDGISQGLTSRDTGTVAGGNGNHVSGGSDVTSFQFATMPSGRNGPCILAGGAGGAAAFGCGALSISCVGSSIAEDATGDGGGVSGGHRTPWLGSPSGSKPVTLPTASKVHGDNDGGGDAAITPPGPPPQANGVNHLAKHINHHHHIHMNGGASMNLHTHHINVCTSAASAVVTVSPGAANGGCGGGLPRAPSLSPTLSQGLDAITLQRYESCGLAPLATYDSFGRSGGVSDESCLLSDPEVAKLLRSIAMDPFWNIRWRDLSHGLTHGLSNMVGSGSIGQVFAGMYLHGEVAIKVIGINREMKYDLRALRAFKHEVDLNKRLNQHTNIVRFIGVCAEYIQHAARQAGLLGDSQATAAAAAAAGAGQTGAEGHGSGPIGLSYAVNQPMLAIVMEYCPMGTLYNMIGEAHLAVRGPRRKGHGCEFLRRWERRLEVLRGAAAGLEYMHRCNVIHHDLTSYNLLLEERNGQWITKVCDFNLSRVMARGGGTGASLTVPNSGNFCSPRWQSPEYLAGQDYGWATDVFSFAVVVWEVVTLQRPWESELQDARYEPVAMHKMYSDGRRLVFPRVEDIRPPLPELPQLVALCQSCWREDPRERPGMNEVAEELMGLLKKVQQREKVAAAARAAMSQRMTAPVSPPTAAPPSAAQSPSPPPPPLPAPAPPASPFAAASAQPTASTPLPPPPPQCQPSLPISPQNTAAAPPPQTLPPPSGPPPVPPPAPLHRPHPRTLVSPFAAAAQPRNHSTSASRSPSASPGTSPRVGGVGVAMIAGLRPKPTGRVSPFLAVEQDEES